MRKFLGFLAVAIATAALPAAAQPAPPDWADFFDEPLYLVHCETLVAGQPRGCINDGLMLVADVNAYPGLVLRIFGGPFRRRHEVEALRASLVRQGMPSHAMRIDMVDRSLRVTNGFWLGARPDCQDRALAGALSGDVSARFGPTLGRPETLPVTDDALGAYEEYVRELRPECEERRRRVDVNTGRDGAAALGSPPPVEDAETVEADVSFEWDRRIRYYSAQCFGPRGAPRPDPCREVVTHYDHYFLNGRFVATDQRVYDRVRARLYADGAFWYERAVRQEESSR